MNRVLKFIKDTFKNIDFKSKRTWVLFGLLIMIGLLSSLYSSYGYYLNSGTKNVVISGTASFGSADIVLQVYRQDRNASGSAINNSYSRVYYLPTTNYTYESSKTVCGSGITLTYDSVNNEFNINATSKGICKVYFAAEGVVVPNASFSLHVEQTMNGGNYKEMGLLPDNDYVYEINTTRTVCTDPNAILNIVDREIEVKTTMDLDCNIYVDIISLTGGGLNTNLMGAYFEENKPAGYRGSSHTDSATQNLYRYTGSYQSSDSGYAGNVDNYICLGSDASSCPDDNIYRIVGIVAEDDATTGLEAGMTKVIKIATIGNYAWDGGTTVDDANRNVNSTTYTSKYTCRTTNGDRNSGCFPLWHESYLNTGILNTTYYNGLSFKDKIAAVKWHCWVGTYLEEPTAAGEYESELCSNTATRIGLLYGGDYLNSYDNGTTKATSSNRGWLAFSNEQWVIPNWGLFYGGSSNYSWGAWRISSDGNLFYASAWGYFNMRSPGLMHGGDEVFPVFYLNKNVRITSGTGTYADPFRV